jgi:hypothetical protein
MPDRRYIDFLQDEIVWKTANQFAPEMRPEIEAILNSE